MLTHNGGRDQKSDVQEVQEVSARMFKVQLCNIDCEYVEEWGEGKGDHFFADVKNPVLTYIRDHPSELRHSPNFSLSDLEEVHMQERGHMQNGKVYLSYFSLILDDNFC